MLNPSPYLSTSRLAVSAILFPPVMLVVHAVALQPLPVRQRAPAPAEPSLADQDEPQCYVCLGYEQPLLATGCGCRGSAGKVHVSCAIQCAAAAQERARIEAAAAHERALEAASAAHV